MREATVILPRAERSSPLRPLGGGEVIGDSPERRVEIISDHEALHATLSRFAAGRDGADLHVHRRHADLFYVLDGELTLRLGPGGEGVAVPAGTLARVPPLVIHGFRNASARDVRYLNLHAPGEDFANYLRALREGRSYVYDQEPPPADGGRPAADAAIGGAETLADGVELLADEPEIAIARLSRVPEALAEPHVSGGLESLYALEGELAITVGDRELRAPPGAFVQVPPGTERAVAAAGTVLVVNTPGAGLRAALDTGQRSGPWWSGGGRRESDVRDGRRRPSRKALAPRP